MKRERVKTSADMLDRAFGEIDSGQPRSGFRQELVIRAEPHANFQHVPPTRRLRVDECFDEGLEFIPSASLGLITRRVRAAQVQVLATGPGVPEFVDVAKGLAG